MGSTGLVTWDKLVKLNESWTSGRAVESIRVSWYAREHRNEDYERFHRKQEDSRSQFTFFCNVCHICGTLHNYWEIVTTGYVKTRFYESNNSFERSNHPPQWDRFVILLYWIVSSLDRLIIEQILFNNFDFPPTRDLALEAAALFRYLSPLIPYPYTHTDVKDGYATLSTLGSGRP